MRRNMHRFSTILEQAEEAWVRWEVLQETVKELQCNLFKGLHEDNAYFERKARQLRQWAATLVLDFQQIIDKGAQLVDSMSRHFLAKRKEQYYAGEQWGGGSKGVISDEKEEKGDLQPEPEQFECNTAEPDIKAGE